MASSKDEETADTVRGLVAVLAIFVFHVVGAAAMTGFARTADWHVRGAIAPTLPQQNLLIYWLGGAVLLAAITGLVLVWTMRVMRRQLGPQFAFVAWFLGALCVTAVVCSILLPMTMIAFPQGQTCAAGQVGAAGGFLCVFPAAPWELLARRDDLPAIPIITTALCARFILNVLFDVTAVMVIGAIITIAARQSAPSTAASPPAPAEPSTAASPPASAEPSTPASPPASDAAHAVPRLMVAGAVVLSAITLNDIIFANWPLAFASAMQTTAKAKGIDLSGTMTAIIFYYAALGSATLGIAIVYARGFAMIDDGSIERPDGALAKALHSARGILFNDATIKAVVALSPVLTTFAGSELVRALLNAAVASGKTGG